MSQPSLDLDLEDRQPTFTVGELAEAINGALRRRFDDGIWVRGEIQGWSKSSAGHIYFNLVETGDDGAGDGLGSRNRPAKATISVAFFAGAQHGPREKFRRANLRLGDGLKVRIHGTLDFFAGNGKLTLKMTDIDVRFTLGDLAQARADVVRGLVARGLYDSQKRLQVSPVPLRVGLVTSAGSAAYADFVDELRRSEIGFQIRLVDVRVQGDGAARMVASAVRSLALCDDLDVIVVLRGGGARTELAVFDDEAIAVAIASSPIPVFTGVGHETDRSIADEVAHTALKTPTACAHELVSSVRLFTARSDEAWAAINRRAADVLAGAHIDIARVTSGIRAHTLAAVDAGQQRLNMRGVRVAAGARRMLDRRANDLDVASATLARMPQRVAAEHRHLDALEARVRALDPAVTMARGWSITHTADGALVRSAADVAVGDTLVTTFAAGAAISIIQEIP